MSPATSPAVIDHVPSCLEQAILYSTPDNIQDSLLTDIGYLRSWGNDRICNASRHGMHFPAYTSNRLLAHSVSDFLTDDVVS